VIYNVVTHINYNYYAAIKEMNCLTVQTQHNLTTDLKMEKN